MAMAVDRDRRTQLGQAVIQLVDGAMTNCQFNDLSQSWECADRAVRIIGELSVRAERGDLFGG